MSRITSAGIVLVVVLAAFAAPKCGASQQSPELGPRSGSEVQAGPEVQHEQQQQDESYLRAEETFMKLMQNVSSNSQNGHVRHLVTRLNKLVGSASGELQAVEVRDKLQSVQSIDDRTDQILNRLDRVDQNTDQHTLAQLNQDVGRLISTLNNAYLRNIRRVVERVNRVVGGPSGIVVAQASSMTQQPAMNRQFQSNGDRVEETHLKLPGFPGVDEALEHLNRLQKSLAHFIRSSTRLITSG